ncbi:MAG: GatB/YqeY domain-containing protein [Chloroflexi bacterium]|nr:GatB/YqeY domain-containing protein [Chloroflexota bacterium]
MTLAQRLQAGMTEAMRERDDVRRDALRMAVAAIQRAEKDARHPLGSDEEIGVLTREIRTRRESLEAFAAGGRPDLAAQEQRKLDALAPYMPAQLDDAQLDALVAQAVDESGATSPRDTGRVMKILAPRVKGRADGRQVHVLVTHELERRARSGGGG